MSRTVEPSRLVGRRLEELELERFMTPDGELFGAPIAIRTRDGVEPPIRVRGNARGDGFVFDLPEAPYQVGGYGRVEHCPFDLAQGEIVSAEVKPGEESDLLILGLGDGRRVVLSDAGDEFWFTLEPTPE